MCKYIFTAFYFLSFLFLLSCEDKVKEHAETCAINLVIESPHSFKKGDEIGLFVEKRSHPDIRSVVGNTNYKTNLKWIYTEEAGWKPATSMDAIYTFSDNVYFDIYAYYPYTKQASVETIPVENMSRIMTGVSLKHNAENPRVKLTLTDRMALVKVALPDADVLSSMQVTIKNVVGNGIIRPSEIGGENDFIPSDVKIDRQLERSNGTFFTFLPEQTLEKNKTLFEVENDEAIKYSLPDPAPILRDKKNWVIIKKTIANSDISPNAFMLQPGDEMFISVHKAYDVWRRNSTLAPYSTDLTGEVSAEIVWQEDRHEIVEKMNVIGQGEDAVIYIKTRPGKKGNAVIAVKIGDTVRWSWHLWVSDYNPSVGKNGVVCRFNGLIFMDRNLGALSASGKDGDETFGLYYQWGRKDPFQTRGRIKTLSSVIDAGSNLINSIIRPDVYIVPSTDSMDWYAGGNNVALDRWNTDKNKKTVFDPCPKGWRIPTTDINGKSPWDGVSIPGEQQWGSGWNFNGEPLLGYYPAAGQRTVKGTVFYAGSAGFYHTANSDATMRFDFVSINLNFGGRKAAGKSVRCVKEHRK